MSAGPSPPNPGQVKRGASGPQASTLRRLGPGLLAGGTAVALAWAYFSAREAPAPNPFRTPGVKNIEGSYRGAGATGTHTPAYGGTTQGKRDDESFRGDGEGTAHTDASPQVKSSGKREFEVSGPNADKGGPRSGGGGDIGEVQRPQGAQATGVGKPWNKFKYGNEDQK